MGDEIFLDANVPRQHVSDEPIGERVLLVGHSTLLSRWFICHRCSKYAFTFGAKPCLIKTYVQLEIGGEPAYVAFTS